MRLEQSCYIPVRHERNKGSGTIGKGLLCCYLIRGSISSSGGGGGGGLDRCVVHSGTCTDPSARE